MGEADQSNVHGALEQGDPRSALISRPLVSIALEGILLVFPQHVVDPARDHPGAKNLTERGDIEGGQAAVDGTLGVDVPADGELRIDVAEGDVGLPFETLDVGGEEVRRGDNDVGRRRGDPERGRCAADWAGWTAECGVRVQWKVFEEGLDSVWKGNWAGQRIISDASSHCVFKLQVKL